MTHKNLVAIFAETVRHRGGLACLRYKDEGVWRTLDWNEVHRKVLEITGGLVKLGVEKGDRVCIFSRTRYEWTLCDLAILACGGITVPIYESNTEEQAAYILDNSGAKIVFVEGPGQLKAVSHSRPRLPALKQVVVFDPPGEKTEDVYTLDELMVLGAGCGSARFQKTVEEITRDDVASYVYTSGTTGPPKGAVLTHGNFIAEIEGLSQQLEFNTYFEHLIFLPLAHILARCVQFAQIKAGFVQCYAESIDKLMDNIAEVKPHMIASVPRIFEKVHTRVMQGVEAGSALKKIIFKWALEVGKKRAAFLVEGKAVPLHVRLQWFFAHRLVFSKLQQRMGGRIEYFISGGAPLSKEIGDFFLSAGFLILEGYGLTETSAALTVNTKDFLRMGTVGKILPGIEIKIADDGEILARGPTIFQGYYKRPEDTQEAVSADGWFRTGDIGIIDADGFLIITDRKKDIIVTAAGKNVAPQNIENLIKTDPLISQVMVHGDKRKYLSALVTLNQEEILHYAREKRIDFKNYTDLVKNDEIYQLIKARIEEKNRNLAKYESIKKFAILESDFSIETGELTPTLKVKRKFTSEKYRDILDRFYQE